MATAADFTIADVLAWARTKPADGGYDYSSNNGCAIACFLIETGRSKNPLVGGDGEWDDRRGRERPSPEGLRDTARGVPFTFGAFADRLEALTVPA